MCRAMSANAGREIRTPVVIPMIVVTAKPFRRPTEAAPMPMNPSNPVNGRSATVLVANAVAIINNAFLILCAIDSLLSRASSKIINCESIPVPIAAIIPAIEGKSKFHPINVATPRIIRTSERETVTNAKETLIFRYLMKTKRETAMIANNPASIICS